MVTILVCLKPIRSSCLPNGQEAMNEICMNPYDIPALMNVIRLKKEIPNCRVVCVSMGVEGAKAMLNRCVALGADQTILLNDSKFAGSDTYATSYILSEVIKKVGKVDIVVCGEKSLDGETGQVPIELATRLKMIYLPHIEQMVSVNGDYAIVQTLYDDILEKSRVCLPFVAVFCGFDLAEPPCSLILLKRARQNQPIQWNSEDLDIDELEIGQVGSKTKVVSVINVKRNNKANYVQGSVEEKCMYLHNIMINNLDYI